MESFKHGTKLASTALHLGNFPPYRSGPKSLRNWKEKDEQEVKSERYRTCTVGMGIEDCICLKEGELTTILCRLQKHNAMNLKKAYHILHVYNSLDWLGRGGVYSTMDPKYKHVQIEMDERNKEKTTFPCNNGLYGCFNRLLKLNTALRMFQRAMDVIISTFKWQLALAYLEYSGTTSRRIAENLVWTRTILGLLSRPDT